MNSTTTTLSAQAPSAADPDAVIADLREQLNVLDAELIEAVARRMELSRQVQAVRMAHGGPRREHSRELKIMNRYSAGLGDGGSTLALTLLEMCRGRA